MSESELADSGVCEFCGENLNLSDLFHFPRSALTAVCCECATRYGGVYDPKRERWRVSPKLPSSFNADYWSG